jgi:hypothetical protein
MRLGLTISGAVSLGAYEGGVLAALLSAVQSINKEDRGAIRIDAIAGASAGSMTALLAARSLTTGCDPVEIMYGAWVDSPQLAKLLDHSRSPLQVERSRADAEALLGAEPRPQLAQSAAVQISMALGSLRGLEYEIRRIGGAPVAASTYLDWGELTIDGSESVQSLIRPSGPVDQALASGAHAAAFPPRGLDRSAQQTDYEANHITNFPPSKFLWYTDGGTLDNQPLGRTLDLANECDREDPLGEESRLLMMITPDPARPSGGDDRWSTPEPPPAWARTGLRSVSLLRSQHLYDDLREVEKTNSRIEWTRQLELALLEILEGEPADAPAALREFSASVDSQKAKLDGPEDLRVDTEPRHTELAAALRGALAAATGIAGKREITVSVISPLLLPELAGTAERPGKVLAGEFLGHFGGFLEKRFRENDFEVGYRCGLAWIKDSLLAQGLEPRLAECGLHGAQRAREEWRERHGRAWDSQSGGASISGLPMREKLQLLRLAFRSLRIAIHQLAKS